VSPEEIETHFASAGWDLDGSFSDYLVVGYSGDGLSILAHKETWDTEDPLFEILDHETMLTYWVREIPTPQRAQELLGEYGEPPEAWEPGPS
jgi:hypothetical protein